MNRSENKRQQQQSLKDDDEHVIHRQLYKHLCSTNDDLREILTVIQRLHDYYKLHCKCNIEVDSID